MHYNDMGARLDMLNNSQIKSPKQPKEKIEIKVSPNQERIITTIDVGSLNNTLWWNGPVVLRAWYHEMAKEDIICVLGPY